MRVYELIFILKPDLPDEEIDAAVELVRSTITEGGATIDKIDKWGKRRLAYRVQHCREGYYVLIQYSLEDDLSLSKEIERRLRVSDSVIKYLTVRTDLDQKRVEKHRLRREKRAARKPPTTAPERPESRGKPRPTPAEPGKPASEEAAPQSPDATT